MCKPSYTLHAGHNPLTVLQECMNACMCKTAGLIQPAGQHAAPQAHPPPCSAFSLLLVCVLTADQLLHQPAVQHANTVCRLDALHPIMMCLLLQTGQMLIWTGVDAVFVGASAIGICFNQGMMCMISLLPARPQTHACRHRPALFFRHRHSCLATDDRGVNIPRKAKVAAT